MAFFVPKNLLPETESEEGEPDARIDLVILVNAKRMGLSFDELSLFRLRDFLEFSNLFFGEQTPKRVQKATQTEIDQFFSRN